MIDAQNLCKAYGAQTVFDEAAFRMGSGERLGLVGRNGSGKSTLFRMLLGEEHPDSGKLVLPSSYTVGHLEQHLHFVKGTILEEVTEVLGERVAEEGYRAEAALMGLGFTREDLSRPASEFSGGFQIRINLARVLVQEPNLLLLDEPTNHLDIVSIRWLERFLRGWKNELMVISHDRGFLSQVTTHSMVIHRQKLRRMQGTVEKLFEQIATEEEVYESARQNDEKKRKREERFIERFRAKNTKAALVKSRIKALERRGRMEALDTEAQLAFSFRGAPFHATNMLVAEGLQFAYPGGPRLVEDLSLTVEKGDRIAIIGPNGRGKTTLLNLLAGELKSDAGSLRSNPNTSMAYFGQTNIDRLHPDNTVEEELLSARPDQTRSQVRGLAGLLMFPGDLVEKSVSVLSGGERSRVLLGRLLVSPSNLLLLDEPTNHLDLESVEGLLDAVDAFDGAVLLVSHDEGILERVATRLVIFDGGRVTLFEGGYRDFLDRIGWASEREDGSFRRPGAKPAGKEKRRARAALVAERGKAASPYVKKVGQLEKSIMRLEKEVAALDAKMARAAEEGRSEAIVKCATEAKQKRRDIDEAFEELELVTGELDQVRAAFDERLDSLGS
jgi:ATP-binding cassette subfamily F protein 3